MFEQMNQIPELVNHLPQQEKQLSEQVNQTPLIGLSSCRNEVAPEFLADAISNKEPRNARNNIFKFYRRRRLATYKRRRLATCKS